MRIGHPDPSKCYAIVKPENLVLGRTYYFKRDHWKRTQVAKILYVSATYVIVEKYYPDDTKTSEHCVDVSAGYGFTFTSVR